MVSSTEDTRGSVNNAFRTSSMRVAAMGHFGVVKVMVTSTAPPMISISYTRPRSTMLSESSGSRTPESEARTASLVMGDRQASSSFLGIESVSLVQEYVFPGLSSCTEPNTQTRIPSPMMKARTLSRSMLTLNCMSLHHLSPSPRLEISLLCCRSSILACGTTYYPRLHDQYSPISGFQRGSFRSQLRGSSGFSPDSSNTAAVQWFPLHM